MLLKSTIIILGLYFLVCILMYINQRNFIYFPGINNYIKYEKINKNNEVIYLKNKNKRLKSWFSNIRANKPIILFFHGNAGDLENRTYKANAFNDIGYNYLFISYRGFNGNDGSPTEENIYADAQFAYNWLLKNGFDENLIIIYGESLGTGVGVEISKNNNPKGLILESPFTSIVEMGKRKFPFLPVQLILKDKYDNLEKISLIKCPVLYLHGKSDNLVPKYMSDILIERTQTRAESYFPENDKHMMNFDKKLMNNIDKFIKNL